MKAYNFAFPQKGPDLHEALFNALKQKGNRDFDLKNENRTKIIFHSIADKIMVRSAIKPDGIISREEILEVTNGDQIKGIVTLSQYKQSFLSLEQIEAFTASKGRKPNKKEIYPYVLLTEDRLNEYVHNIFERAGMKLTKFIDIDSGDRHFKKNNMKFKAIDIVFEATVTDLSAFEPAWFNGIGRYKTMGFGMLRVVKL